MPANLTPEYRAAEGRFRAAVTTQDKLAALDQMYATIPKRTGVTVMIAAFVLVTGVMLVLVVGAIALIAMGNGHILPSLVPLAPLLVVVGSVMLIFTEFLLFLGNKDDRRSAMRDLGYLVPTLIISGGLWWVAQRFLW